MTKLDILNKNIDKQAQTKLGIQYTQKMKRAALESMQEYADQQLLIHGVVSSAKMYKATFSFKKYSPRGGNGYWTTEIVPIQAKDETELKEKIATYQANDHNSYHKHIKLTSIELM